MINSNININVRYSEVDKLGFVYYSRYLEYFEIGRADWLEKNILDYSKIESEYNIGVPIVECTIQYKKAATYGDNISLITACDINVLPKILLFSYEIYLNEKLLVTGTTKHLFYDMKLNKTTLLPEELYSMLK